MESRPRSSKAFFAFDWVASIRSNSSQTFLSTVKYFFMHRLKLRWIGKSTNSRHECQSLRYSCRSTASGLSCSSGKTADAFVRSSPNSNGERAYAWRVSVAFVKKWGSQVIWVLFVAARQSECTGPWNVMKKGYWKKWATTTDTAIYCSTIGEYQSTCKAKNSSSLRLVVTNEKQCRTHRH